MMTEQRLFQHIFIVWKTKLRHACASFYMPGKMKIDTEFAYGMQYEYINYTD